MGKTSKFRPGKRKAIYIDPKKALKRFKEPKVKLKFEKALKKWEKRTKPLIEASMSSQDIGPEDLKIIVRTSR